MEDKQLLAQFAAAAWTGLIASKYESDRVYSRDEEQQYVIKEALRMARAMLAEFKQRTEQKGNG